MSLHIQSKKVRKGRPHNYNPALAQEYDTRFMDSIKFIIEHPDDEIEGKAINDKCQSWKEYYESFLPLLWEETRYSIFHMAKDVNTQWNYGQISRVRGGKSDNIYNVHIKDNELMCNDLVYCCPRNQADFEKENRKFIGVMVNRDKIKPLYDVPFDFEYMRMRPMFNLTTTYRIYRSIETAKKLLWSNFLKESHRRNLVLEDDTVLDHFTDQQSKAIQYIKQQKDKSGIHMIHGPPGCGKTSVIIELVKNYLNAKKPAKKFNWSLPMFTGINTLKKSAPAIYRTLLTSTTNYTILHLVNKVISDIEYTGKKWFMIIANHDLVDESIHKHLSTSYADKYFNCYNLLITVIEKAEKFLDEKKNHEFFQYYVNEWMNRWSQLPYHNTVYMDICKTLHDSAAYLEEESMCDYVIEFFQVDNVPKPVHTDKFKDALEKLRMIIQPNPSKMEWEAQLLLCCPLILGTLSSAGSPRAQEIPFDAVLIDEAAQAPEVNVLPALNLKPKTMILVGDPNQMTIGIYNPKVIQLGFNKSLMERLIENQHPIIMLNKQFRMHSAISQFPSSYIYKGELTDGLEEDPPLLNDIQAYKVVHLEQTKEKVTPNRSYVNEAEAEYILNLLQKEEWKGVSTTILTPYTAQRDYMNKNNKLDNVKIYTIDSFQGREDDAVILSCVRTEKIGFIQELARINVVLTRGKRIFWIIGNLKILAKNEHWKALITNAVNRKMFSMSSDL